MLLVEPPAGKRARHAIFTGKIVITTTLLPLLRRPCSLHGNGRMAYASRGICGGARHHLTGPDGKVLIDAGIGVSRPQITRALAGLGADPITQLINTHWHFDHADGNVWLNSVGAKIIAHENTRKHLSEVQRVEDWDYNFLPLQTGGLPGEVFSSEHKLKLNGIAVDLSDLAFEPLALAVKRSNVVVSERAPFFLDLADGQLPITFDTVPSHVTLLSVSLPVVTGGRCSYDLNA